MGQSDDWAVYSLAQGGRAVSQKDSMNLNILKHVSHGTVKDDCQQLGSSLLIPPCQQQNVCVCNMSCISLSILG